MATLTTLAALALTGQALAAGHAGAAGMSPERMIAATADPDGASGGRGRGGYGYGATTPPSDVLPSTPPSDVLPSTPPVSAVPIPSASESPTGVSPETAPGELPVTGSPMAALLLIGGVLAVAGIAIRYAARRRRPY